MSYCSIENVQSLINRHNKEVLVRENNKNDQSKSICNCSSKDSCPLDRSSLQENAVYKALLNKIINIYKIFLLSKLNKSSFCFTLMTNTFVYYNIIKCLTAEKKVYRQLIITNLYSKQN